MRRRNISWEEGVDDLAEKLAKESGKSVSEFLAALINREAENPSSLPVPTPGLMRLLRETAEKAAQEAVRREVKYRDEHAKLKSQEPKAPRRPGRAKGD